MGFDIDETSVANNAVTVNEKLWLAADGETVVADGDPAAQSLLAVPGDTLSRDDAVKYGLVKATKEEKAAASADESDEEPEKQPARSGKKPS